jgi:hypothetical protein
LEQRPFRRPLSVGQLAERQGLDVPGERSCRGPGTPILTNHLIEELTGIVIAEFHKSKRTRSAVRNVNANAHPQGRPTPLSTAGAKTRGFHAGTRGEMETYWISIGSSSFSFKDAA